MDEAIREAVAAEIRKTKRKRLKMDAVLQAVRRLPLGVRSDFEIQKRLLKTLEAMAEEGSIHLPSSKPSWDRLTGLPNFVRVDRSDDDAEKRLSLADLDCFYCTEPLPFRPFSLNIEETRGLPLLVVENNCTYWSCCRANESLKCYAAVVYGKGFEACASDQVTAVERAGDGLRGIEGQVGASGVRYSGDLDPTGLAIPRRINRHRENAGAPPMTAEVRLYRALLEMDRTTPCLPSQAKDHDPDWTREWLGEELAEMYLSSWGDERWPQEGVTEKGILRTLDNSSG